MDDNQISPNRWMRLKNPKRFTPAEFEHFRANCAIWKVHTEAVLSNWSVLSRGDSPAPIYIFFDPEISEDRTIVSLPIGGEWSLGARAIFENHYSSLLWAYFSPWLLIEMEEGLSEYMPDDLNFPDQLTLRTNWRSPLKAASDSA